VDEAGKTMEQIVTSVKRVTGIMSEIAAAAQEQGSGIEEVISGHADGQITQQNAALVEQAAAAAESMQEQARNMGTGGGGVQVYRGRGAPGCAGEDETPEAPRPRAAPRTHRHARHSAPRLRAAYPRSSTCAWRRLPLSVAVQGTAWLSSRNDQWTALEVPAAQHLL